MKVAAPQKPLTTIELHLHIIVSVACLGRFKRTRRLEEINVELELRIRNWGGPYESCVATLQQIAKRRILSAQRDCHPANLDGNRVTRRKLRDEAHSCQRFDSRQRGA